MEPKRGLIIKQVTVEGKTLEPSNFVWILQELTPGLVTVEIKNKLLRIPHDAVLPCPIPQPSLNELHKRDECFGQAEEFFHSLHDSKENWFRILRCKAHGRLFLEDTRGGIAMYNRLIAIDEAVDEDSDDFDAIWRHYHSMSDDWLNYLGIAL